MRYRPKNLGETFEKFKSGEQDAIDDIFASERSRLFDFLIRMTGQVSRSVDVCDEAIASVRPLAGDQESLQSLLVLLYRTARNFIIDIWNADTSRLENSSYGAVSMPASKDIAVMVALEHVIRSLTSKQREILLLRERYGFSTDEISLITGYPMDDVEEVFAQALSITESILTNVTQQVPELITLLKVFPIPEQEILPTQNLSSVFKNLKKTHTSFLSFKTVLLALVLLASAWYVFWVLQQN